MIVQIVVSFPSQTLLRFGVGLRLFEILEVVIRKRLGFALATHTNDLCHTDVYKVLQKLIQSVISVAPVTGQHLLQCREFRQRYGS